jgi:hypothetical protein
MPPIRARDLRVNIKEMGFEKGVVHTLELALEELSAVRGHIRDMAEMVQQCINETEKMVAIGGRMKDELQQLHRDIKGDDHDSDPS